jgi:hypothetical protein
MSQKTQFYICFVAPIRTERAPLHRDDNEVTAAHRPTLVVGVEPDPVKVYWGYAAPFESWSRNYAMEEYPPLPKETVEEIEALLIFAHQPVYNATK